MVYDGQGVEQVSLAAAPIYYAASVLSDPNADADLVNLVKAIYNYTVAADAVFED